VPNIEGRCMRVCVCVCVSVSEWVREGSIVVVVVVRWRCWYRCESRARPPPEHIVLLCMAVCLCVRARTYSLATWRAGPAWTHTHTHRDVLESLGRWANSAAGPPPPMPSWLRWRCAAGGGPAACDARDPNRRPSRLNVWIFFFSILFL